MPPHGTVGPEPWANGAQETTAICRTYLADSVNRVQATTDLLMFVDRYLQTRIEAKTPTPISDSTLRYLTIMARQDRLATWLILVLRTPLLTLRMVRRPAPALVHLEGIMARNQSRYRGRAI